MACPEVKDFSVQGWVVWVSVQVAENSQCLCW